LYHSLATGAINDPYETSRVLSKDLHSPVGAVGESDSTAVARCANLHYRAVPRIDQPEENGLRVAFTIDRTGRQDTYGSAEPACAVDNLEGASPQ